MSINFEAIPAGTRVRRPSEENSPCHPAMTPGILVICNVASRKTPNVRPAFPETRPLAAEFGALNEDLIRARAARDPLLVDLSQARTGEAFLRTFEATGVPEDPAI